MTLIVLACTLLLQLLTIAVAVGHVRKTGWTLLWGLIVPTLTLMGLRTALAVFGMTLDLHAGTIDPVNAWIALGESIMIFIGIFLFGSRLGDVRHAESALRATRQNLSAVIETSPQPIIATDLAGCVTIWSKAAEKTFGWQEAEVLHKPNPTLRDNPAAEILAVRQRVRQGETVRYEKAVRTRKDGTRIDVLQSVAPLLDTANNLTGYLEVLADESELNRAFELLRNNEELFRTVFENTGTATVMIEEDTTISFANAEFERLSQCSKDEIEGKRSWTEFVVKEDLERMRKQHTLRREKPGEALTHYEFKFVTKTGRVRDIYLSNDVIPGTKKSIASLRDITERKQAEERLQASERTLKLFVELAPAAIAMFDRDMRYIAVSRKFLTDYKLEDQNVIGRSHYELFPDIPERWREIHKRGLAGSVERAEEDPFPHADGRVDWVRWEVHPWYAEPGQIGGIILSWEMITERKAKDRALKESEARLSAIFHHSPMGIVLTQQADGRIVDVNAAFAELHGYTPAEIIGRSSTELQMWANPAERDAMISQLHEHGTCKDLVIKGRKKNGEIRDLRISVELIELGGERLTIGMAQDITERVHGQKHLYRLNECLLNFGADPLENINRLVALGGELLEADTALYNRLDQGMLCSWGQWHAPQGYNPQDKPDGHICYDVIRANSDVPFVVRHLQQTPYAQSDPNVASYHLGTYIGQSVKFENKGVGSICMVYQRDFVPSKDQERMLGIIASAIAVEENRRTAEEALRESEERFRVIYESSPVGILSVDARGKVLRSNRAFEKIIGYGEKELSTMTFSDFTYPADREIGLEALQRMIAGKTESARMEKRYVRKDGSIIWASVIVSVIRDKNQKLQYTVSIVEDITPRKRIEEELLFRNLILTTQQDASIDGILMVDEQGRILSYNRRFVEMWGIPEKLVQDGIDAPLLQFVRLQMADPGAFIQRVEFLYEHKQETSQEEIVLNDGHVFDRFSAPMLGPGERYYGRIWYFHDITERKQAEAQLLASLKEKEILLKEIHHRVKNNLQVVCSLLSIQAQNLPQGESRTFLHDTETRVRSMALVHEKLYRSGNLAGIDFGDYVTGLTDQIKSSFNQGGITCSVISERVILGIDVAIPGGLIANELITNAYKHGFKDRNHGEILITIKRLDPQTVSFSVHDNGAGFSPDADFRTLASMGMTIVNSLTEQISGTIAMENSNGTTFVITFPA